MLISYLGARGGKRSVTHLSKAQLARKRANDREAQRNIRQRTKEHIENLERKVQELEATHSTGSGGRSRSVERILKRNKDLEQEVELLRAQLSTQSRTPSIQQAPDIPEELLIPQKVTMEWIPPLTTSQWPVSMPAHISSIPENSELASNPDYTAETPIYEETSAIGYEENPVPAIDTPVWKDSAIIGPRIPQTVAKQTAQAAWTPFHPAISEPSRFSALQSSGFNDLMTSQRQPETNSTCWQNQPSVYAWQISTKLKAPTTYVDNLMFQVIHTQRHLSITADLTGEDIIGPSFPSVHLLFNQPGPINKKPSNLTEIMARYSAVLSNRGFALIPEKLASFMCMYRFVQWQISPTYGTYSALHNWQAPEQSQLLIPHPAWMDLPPWRAFREKVIRNQERYDNVEFQNDYASNLCVNFPHDPMKALIFEDGQIMISPMLERHLGDISNMSMKKPFADKYPEFVDSCRFEEV